MRRERTIRRVIWSSTSPPGTELCMLRKEERGWSLKGSIGRRFTEGRGAIVYQIRVSDDWRTRDVHVEQLLEGDFKVLDIRVLRGRWLVRGAVDPNLDGCVDVDLEASPATNTLPIRRSRLPRGGKVVVKAAWVRFPSLKVVPLEQSYENQGERKYIYRSGNSFQADLNIDRYGLVVRYGSYWVAA